MKSIKINVNSYIKKLSFVKADLEYHRAEHLERKRGFLEDLYEFMTNKDFKFSEKKISENMMDPYKKEENDQPPDLAEQSKKLFRDIAKATHPDKNPGEEKKEIFTRAQQAYSEGDWYTLYDIGLQLGFDPGEFNEHHVEWLKQEIEKVEAVVASIKNTLEWQYGEPKVNKETILTSYCKATCDIPDEDEGKKDKIVI